MMYSDKFVVALKHNGKVLREFGDIAYLPFGQEYTILLKNLNSRRAKVALSIDGTDVGDGTSFIVNANSEMEIKRFIRNGNLNEGNAFKFIERTQAVDDHRGIKADDGILRVEFWYEREFQLQQFINSQYFPKSITNHTGSDIPRGITCSAAGGVDTYSSTIGSTAKLNDVGITVPGNVVSQEFKQVNNFLAETVSHVIVLRLAGETIDNIPVVKPITVAVKPKCSSCGKPGKATAKFCAECGTSLVLV